MDALDGVTILDFTAGIAGPYCTKLLADLGARVIKVERPGGDPARATGPWLGKERGIERSAAHQFLNTNKESIVIDLKSAEGQAVVDDLLPRVTLVVESFPPVVSARLGLTYERVAKAAHVPLLSITNFGSSGPYRDYSLSDLVLYAMGAEMYSHGIASREPVKLGGTAAQLQSGATAAIAAMGAVIAFEAHDIGQHVEVALFETQLANVDRRSSALMGYQWSGRVNSRPLGSSAGIAGGVYPTADGFVEVTASGGNYWRRFARMIGEPLTDPKFESPAFAATPAAKEEADAAIYPWMLSHTKLEVWEAARAQHALVAPIMTGEDLFNDPVLRERGFWTEVEHEVLGTFPMLGRPYVLEKTPWRIRNAAPMLGQHTDSILGETGRSGDAIAELRRQGAVA